MRRSTIVPAALVLALAAAPLAAQGAQPRLTVTLERTDLASREWVRGEAWVENTTARELRSATLRITGPQSLKLGALRGQACTPLSAPLPLRPVAPGSYSSVPFCLAAEGEVVEGKQTVVFTVDYVAAAGAGMPARRGFAQVERSVDLGLLGPAEVAGTHLRYLDWVLPGIILFGILGFAVERWHHPGQPTLKIAAAGGSVAASAVLALLLNLAYPPHVARGTSLNRLLVLCAMALLAGTALAAGLRARRRYLDGLKIEPTDDALAVAEKLLRNRKTARGPVEVVTDAGGELVGALGGRTSDGGAVVLGWLGVPQEGDEAARRALLRVATRGDEAALAHFARVHDLQPVPRFEILRREGDQLIPVANGSIRWIRPADGPRIQRRPPGAGVPSEPPLAVLS